MNSRVSNYLSTCKNCNPKEGDKQREDKKPTLNEVTQHIKQLQMYRNSKEINLAKLRISVEVLTLPVAFNLAVTAQRDYLEERFCFASMWFFYGNFGLLLLVVMFRYVRFPDNTQQTNVLKKKGTLSDTNY